MEPETKEFLLICCGVILLITGVMFIVSLPFALLGWLLLSFVNVFGAGILTSYFNCAITGIVTGIITGAIAK